MEAVDGYILTGGAGSRMGADKASLRIGSSTFVERIAASLSRVTNHVFTVGGPNVFQGLEHIPDRRALSGTEVPDKKSSIVGLYSALQHARTEWILVVACDMPFVTTELFETLLPQRSGECGAVAPLTSDGTIQPLCALYRVSGCLGLVEQAISDDRRSLWRLLEEVGVIRVPFESLGSLPGSEQFFVNVNTTDDYALAVAEFEAAAIATKLVSNDE